MLRCRTPQTNATKAAASAAAAKRALRRAARLRRAAAAAAQPQASEAVCAALAKSRLLRRRAPLIGGYAAMGSELDALPVLRACLRLNRRVALPVIVGQSLRFVAWDGLAPLRRMRRGVRAPHQPHAVGVPQILFVPLLAYDATGHRLGRGGGHYDRFLAWARARAALIAVGLAFAEQKMARLPVAASDQRLDAVCTPDGLVWMRRAPLGRL